MKKFFCFILSCFLLFGIISCSDIAEKDDFNSDSEKKAYINFNFSSPTRTVRPEIDLSELTDILIEGDLQGDVSDHFKQSFSTRDTALSKGLVIETGIWDFSLSAKIGNINFAASLKDKEIVAGENTLDFILEVSEVGSEEGRGSVSITLSFPDDSGVKVVKAGLFTVEDDELLSGFELKSLRVKNDSVSYTVSSVPVGNYRFKAMLYADDSYTALINTYREIVTVVEEKQSSAARTLANLNKIYSINYVKNEGEISSAYAAPEVYTRSSEFMLSTAENITRSGYAFVGWYETADFSSERITKISKNMSGDKTFYAKWAIGEVVTSENLSSLNLSNIADGYTLAVVGDVSLESLAAKLKNSAGSVNLDLFASSSLSFSDSLFANCTKISSVVLPENLSSIGDEAFLGCSELTEFTITSGISSLGENVFGNCSLLTSISVEEGNSEYKSLDGILFSKDGSILIQYPAGKSGETYSINESVTKVGAGAFSGNTNLLTIEIGAKLTEIAGTAFNDCPALSAFTVDSSNPVYDDNNGSGILYKDTLLFRYPEGKTATSFTLQSWVTEIGDYAFYKCVSLETITIPSSSELKKIGIYAFYGCSSLENMNLPESLEYVGGNAFTACKSNFSYYTVTFISNGGSNVSALSVKSGELLLLPEDPTRSGYSFTGWYTSNTNFTSSYKFSSASPITANKTLYAGWSILTYSISYSLSGGTNSSANPSSYNVNTATISLANPTKTGYTFKGWYTTLSYDSTSRIEEIPSGSTGNLNLYAQWEIITYSITYHISSKGSLPADAPHSYTVEDAEITLLAPSSETETFVGWYTSEELTTILASIQAGSTGDIEVWAGWLVSEGTKTISVSWLKNASADYYYYFDNYSGNIWRSTNYNKNSWTASSTWTITLPCEISVSIPYRVSSESYDKLTVTLDGTKIVSSISGETSGTYTKILASGSHTLTASYEKDSSRYSGDDRAYITLNPVYIPVGY